MLLKNEYLEIPNLSRLKSVLWRIRIQNFKNLPFPAFASICHRSLEFGDKRKSHKLCEVCLCESPVDMFFGHVVDHQFCFCSWSEITYQRHTV